MTSDIKVGLVPFGRLSDGSHAFYIDPTTELPLATIMEVLSSLPTTDDPNNFVGRLVFSIANRNVYIFNNPGSPEWIGLKAAAVTIGAAAPTPALLPSPGDLYYSTDTELLYLWDSLEWIVVGGQRGADVVWRHYTANGIVSLFDTGVTTLPPVEFVQVFSNGAELLPGAVGTRDYYMVANSVQLNAVPTAGTKISTRTITYKNLGRTSKLIANRYVSDGNLSTNAYDTGITQASTEQVFVTVDGVMQQPFLGGAVGTYDYKIASQDVSISAITSVGTTVTATTTVPHGLAVGRTVTIYSVTPAAYNGSFLVTNVVGANQFQYTALSAPGSPGAADTGISPIMYYGPVSVNDKVVFYNASGSPENVPNTAVVSIRTIENISVSSGGSGDVASGTSLGTGAAVYKDKVGSSLRFRSVKPGTNVTIVEGTDDVTINALNEHFVKFTIVNGIPSNYVVTGDDLYISVRNTTGGPISIDLRGISLGGSSTGRRIYVKDAALNASTNNITLIPNAASAIERLDGTAGTAGQNLVLDQDGQLVCLVMDGTNWEVLFTHPGVAGPPGPTGDTGDSGIPGDSGVFNRQVHTGTPSTLVLSSTGNYVGVRNASAAPVTVDLYTNVASPGGAGRYVTIKDELGNAGTYAINVNPGAGRKIDGGSVGAPLAIATNRGRVTLAFDGTDWHTVS